MEELPLEEAHQLLRSSRVGVLALADGGKAYAVPVHFAYDGRHVYFHGHPGLKTHYTEATKEACLAVTTIIHDDEWESVLVLGPVEPVTMTDEILAAMDALTAYPPPPQFGTTSTGQPKRSNKDKSFWRLVPKRITGRKSQAPPPPDAEMATA